MLFNTPTFLLFLLVVFGIYYLPFLKKQQVLILVLASLIFYSFEKFEYVLLLLVSASINILCSYLVVYGSEKTRKPIAISGLIANILILFFFKYGPLISKTFLEPNDSIGHFLLYLPLPIGISFFTFEGISLVVDVWKEKYIKGSDIVSKNLLNHTKKTIFFISFFPHLIAGPILKAHDFYPQIMEKKLKDIKWQFAFKAIVIGYFLKMVVADNLKDFTTQNMMYPSFEWASSLTLLSYVFGYSCQIFADFAGYSSIAIGLGLLFGYNLNQNFNFPYISTSFREFWKRWHISLSTFLMEYLYIPLGGSRKGVARTYLNLILTMSIGGFWHGAGWTYALWGFLHGLVLVLERICKSKTEKKHNFLIKFIQFSITFWVVSFFWLFFKLPDLYSIVSFLVHFSLNIYLPNNIPVISYILVYSSPVLVYHAVYLLRRGSTFDLYFKKTEFVWYAILLFLILLNSGTIGTFIYFQF